MSEIKQYFENGNLKATGLEIDGLMEGKWIFYYEDGKVCKEINFKKGVEHGEWKMWHDNGNLYLIQFKQDGCSIGLWKEYYEDGKLREVGEFINGEYFPHEFWDEYGNQLLRNGTGKKIEKFGYLELEIVEQYYLEGKFIKEEKVSSSSYGKFKPKE